MTFHLVLAASPMTTPLWMTAALIAFLLLVVLVVTLLYYRKGNRANVARDSGSPWANTPRMQMARTHPLLYGVSVGIVVLVGGLWAIETHHQMGPGAIFVLFVLAAGATLLSTIAGYLARRAQPH